MRTKLCSCDGDGCDLCNKNLVYVETIEGIVEEHEKFFDDETSNVSVGCTVLFSTQERIFFSHFLEKFNGKEVCIDIFVRE